MMTENREICHCHAGAHTDVAIPIEFRRRLSYDTLLKTAGDSYVASLLGMTALL